MYMRICTQSLIYEPLLYTPALAAGWKVKSYDNLIRLFLSNT